MKILTVGLSPYMNLSHARIHSMVVKHLYFSHHEVACAAVGHDVSYFLPKPDNDNNPRFYYSFDNHDIPLIPLDVTKEPSIALYEMIKVLKPEMVLTIGDFSDFWYMKAVKMFVETEIKWLAVMSNYSYPINEKNSDLIDDMDGILCTNKKTYDIVSSLFKKDEISLSHVGCSESSKFTKDRDKLRKSRNLDAKFRIMSCGKNLQSDNVPMLIEAVANLREEIPDLELYLHSNIHDRGDYDLNLLKDRFDPKDEFIKFPDKYVSSRDGYTNEEYEQELVSSDLFVSVSLNSSSGLSIFESISCGCLPLMTNSGCYQDISSFLEEMCSKYKRNDFLIPCIEVMMRGEVYVNICKPDALQKGIARLYANIKKGYKVDFHQFIKSHDRKMFLDSILNMIEALKHSAPTICVETV